MFSQFRNLPKANNNKELPTYSPQQKTMKLSTSFSSFTLSLVVTAAATTPATATSNTGIRGGAGATTTTTTTAARKLEDGLTSASHKLLIGATDRGMYIENFEYKGSSLIAGDGSLTPAAKKLLSGSTNDMRELVAFKDIVFNNGCGGKGGGSAFDNLSYDGSRPPVNPPTVEIQEDFDCEGEGGTLIDYLLCTADLIDICNSSSNCELKPGPICSCTKPDP